MGAPPRIWFLFLLKYKKIPPSNHPLIHITPSYLLLHSAKWGRNSMSWPSTTASSIGSWSRDSSRPPLIKVTIVPCYKKCFDAIGCKYSFWRVILLDCCFTVTVVDSGNKALEFLGLIREQQKDSTCRDQAWCSGIVFFRPFLRISFSCVSHIFGRLKWTS